LLSPAAFCTALPSSIGLICQARSSFHATAVDVRSWMMASLQQHLQCTAFIEPVACRLRHATHGLDLCERSSTETQPCVYSCSICWDGSLVRSQWQQQVRTAVAAAVQGRHQCRTAPFRLCLGWVLRCQAAPAKLHRRPPPVCPAVQQQSVSNHATGMHSLPHESVATRGQAPGIKLPTRAR
jgi:hypothetical protein